MPHLSLQSKGSPFLGVNVNPFRLGNCRLTLYKISHLKNFAATVSLDIIFITESWFNEVTPNGWLPLWNTNRSEAVETSAMTAITVSTYGEASQLPS